MGLALLREATVRRIGPALPMSAKLASWTALFALMWNE
jgi:hypothetical protein